MPRNRFGVLADNLDKRTAEITVGIKPLHRPRPCAISKRWRPTASVRSGISTVVLRNVERNPQQFIFGGRPPLPQYSGSR
jgi:phospholipid/cholesterol/gamma-HCH transport system substrate-binding protein